MKNNASRQPGRNLTWANGILALACSLPLLAAGCTDSSSGARAEFGRPRAFALNGQAIFIGAATDPRMRVYSLNSHKVIRAPNPIFSLSVPTIAPTHTVASFRSPDGLISSPFVLTLSPMRGILSVASAKNRNLVGYARTPGVPLALTVLPMASSEDDTVAILAAMVDGKSMLYRVRLPASLEDKAITPATLSFEKLSGIDLGGVIPQDLLASPTHPSLVAIADRAGLENGILLADVEAGTLTPVATNAPMTSLAFDAKGERLFALIDSDACSLARAAGKLPESSGEEVSASSDTSGESSGEGESEGESAEGSAEAPGSKAYYNNIASEDHIEAGSSGSRSGLGLGSCTGLIAIDVAGASLVKGTPLQVPGILRTLAVGGSVELKLPSDDKRTVDPLVLVGSSEGTIYPVDGDKIALIRADNSKYSVTLTHVDANGRASYLEEEITDLSVNPLRSVTEIISITYEGRLPDFHNRTGLLTEKGIVSEGTDFAAFGVSVGDRIEIRGAKAPCKTFEVSSVDPGLLGISSGVDESCTGQAVYDVRTAGQYVVTGTVTGYMGRVSDGEVFTFDGPPPFDFGEDEVSEAPALQFTMSAQDHTVGGGWRVRIKYCTEPYKIPITAVTFPTDMTADPVSGDFYIAYQGGNALIRVVPEKLVQDSVSTSNGLSLFR